MEFDEATATASMKTAFPHLVIGIHSMWPKTQPKLENSQLGLVKEKLVTPQVKSTVNSIGIALYRLGIPSQGVCVFLEKYDSLFGE